MLPFLGAQERESPAGAKSRQQPRQNSNAHQIKPSMRRKRHFDMRRCQRRRRRISKLRLRRIDGFESMGVAVLQRPMPGFRPGGRLPFLGAQERKQRNRPCRMALRVRCGAQVYRAAPNSLRYAPFRQGARSLSLMALRAARQTLRSSPMRKGNTGISIRLAAHRLGASVLREQALVGSISNQKSLVAHTFAPPHQSNTGRN